MNMNVSDRIWCDLQVNSIHKEKNFGPTHNRHFRRISLEKAEAIVKGCKAFGTARLYTLGSKIYVVRVEFI